MTLASDQDDRGVYTGWIAGAVVIVAVLLVGAGFWIYFHG